MPKRPRHTGLLLRHENQVPVLPMEGSGILEVLEALLVVTEPLEEVCEIARLNNIY